MRLAVDIGGTFTDVVLERDDELFTTKILTTPELPDDGVVAGISGMLAESGVAAESVSLFIHGTTLATNAILERTGATTALITTEGFRDVLEIGYEGRYDQYDLLIEGTRPLVPRTHRLTVPERINAQGSVIRPLNEEAVWGLVPKLQSLAVDSVAVGFLHAYANPAHELRVREILEQSMPGISVSISSEVCPEVREYERFTTTCANAYISPLMAGYLARLERRLTELGLRCPALLMTSSGGLTTFETAIRYPIRLVESGPAGGAILASQLAAELRLAKAISFDMGGTTAKICLIEHQSPQATREFEIDRAARFVKGSGLPLRLPVIEMLEIGSGGGSIARVDTMGKVVVGPDSAGADPGPAAYGRGGERPTVTDADIVLGRIDSTRFASGQVVLKAERAAIAITRDLAEPLGVGQELAAYSVAEMVDETMANAARVHTVEKGQVAAEHTLIAFGGAAPLHVGRLAEKLGVGRIVVPRNAGVGSAIGFLRAPVAYEVVRSRNMRLGEFDSALVNAVFEDMALEARAIVEAATPGRSLVADGGAYMRYLGQGHEIYVPLPVEQFTAADAELLRDRFECAYAHRFSRVIRDAEIEVLTWVLSMAVSQAPGAPLTEPQLQPAPAPREMRNVIDPGNAKRMTVPVFERTTLVPGSVIDGPTLIVEAETSTFVPAKGIARISANGHIVIDIQEGSA